VDPPFAIRGMPHAPNFALPVHPQRAGAGIGRGGAREFAPSSGADHPSRLHRLGRPEPGIYNPDGRWEFGWNGDRLSNGHDTKKLIAHDPIVHQWVIDVLKQAERLSN
jgi:hypothetical protein